MRGAQILATVVAVVTAITMGVRCAKESSAPALTDEQIEQHRAHIRAAAAQLAYSAPIVLPPAPPTAPRLVTAKIELPPQVYLGHMEMLAHKKNCPAVTTRMVRTPVVAARMQGYRLHDACATLVSEPEYRVQVTMHPAWVEHERRLDAIKLAEASTPATGAPFVSQSSYSSPSSSSQQPTSSGSSVVHVKGYTRNDGTYVPPHTRSKPRK